jgi:hypothetical protein
MSEPGLISLWGNATTRAVMMSANATAKYIGLNKSPPVQKKRYRHDMDKGQHQ